MVNPGFVRQHGISATEVLGKTFFDILPHKVAEDAAAIIGEGSHALAG